MDDKGGESKLRVAEVPRLSLRPAEAAAAMGVSERKLWSLTAGGEIPHIKLGKVVLYPTRILDEWLVRQCGPQQAGGTA